MLRIIRIAYHACQHDISIGQTGNQMFTVTRPYEVDQDDIASQLESVPGLYACLFLRQAVFIQKYLGVQGNFHGRGYRISLFLAQTLSMSLKVLIMILHRRNL